jgi:hypothetical protein
MWVFTQTGFVSAVRHRDEPDSLVVRARDRASITPLADFCGTDVLKYAGSDYPYRTFVKEADYKNWLTRSVEELDYANYKDRMHDLRDDRFCIALSKVWSTMLGVEDYEAINSWR